MKPRRARSFRSEDSPWLGRAAPALAGLFFSLCLLLFILSWQEKRERADDELKHRFLHGQDRYSEDDSLYVQGSRIFAVNEESRRGPMSANSRQPTAVHAEGGGQEEGRSSNSPKMGFYFAGSLQNGSGPTPGQASLQQLQNVAGHKTTSGSGNGLGYYFAKDIPERVKQSGRSAPGGLSTTIQTSITFSSGASDSQMADDSSREAGQGSVRADRVSDDDYDPQGDLAAVRAQDAASGTDSQGADAALSMFNAAAAASQQQHAKQTTSRKVTPGHQAPPAVAANSKPLGWYFQKDAKQVTGGADRAKGAVLPSREEEFAAAADSAGVKPALGYYFGLTGSDERQQPSPKGRLLLRGAQQQHIAQQHAQRQQRQRDASERQQGLKLLQNDPDHR